MPRRIADMTPAEAAAALAWLAEMGADEIVGEEPVNRLTVGASLSPGAGKERLEERARREPPEVQPFRAAARLNPPPPGAGSAKLKTSGLDPVQDARALAAGCASLAEIAAVLAGFDACPLRRTASNLCYTDGNPQARVLVIGEAPGNEEDLQGKPFVGRSGQLLDRMLAAVGLDRGAEDPSRAVLITNMIFWRPPGNRKPTEPETLMCLPFVRRTIEVMRPGLVLLVGATPAQRLLDTTQGILKLRGRWTRLAGEGWEVPAMATLHPAYLLRQPAQKRLAWRDLLAFRKRLDQLLDQQISR